MVFVSFGFLLFDMVELVDSPMFLFVCLVYGLVFLAIFLPYGTDSMDA